MAGRTVLKVLRRQCATDVLILTLSLDARITYKRKEIGKRATAMFVAKLWPESVSLAFSLHHARHVLGCAGAGSSAVDGVAVEKLLKL